MVDLPSDGPDSPERLPVRVRTQTGRADVPSTDGDQDWPSPAGRRALAWPTALIAATCAAFAILAIDVARLDEATDRLAKLTAETDLRFRVMTAERRQVAAGPVVAPPDRADPAEAAASTFRGGAACRQAGSLPAAEDGKVGKAGVERGQPDVTWEVPWLLVALWLPVLFALRFDPHFRAWLLPPPWVAPCSRWDLVAFFQGVALVFCTMAFGGLVQTTGFPGSIAGGALVSAAMQAALCAAVVAIVTAPVDTAGEPCARWGLGRHWQGGMPYAVAHSPASAWRGESLGLSARGAWENSLRGVAGSFAALVPAILAGYAAGLAIPSKPHPVLVQVMTEAGQREIALLVLVASVVAPVFEEVLFRGFVYATARDRLGPAAGMALSAFLFALPHPGFANQAATFVLGLAFVLLYERSGTLVAPIVAHAAFNAVNILPSVLIGLA